MKYLVRTFFISIITLLLLVAVLTILPDNQYRRLAVAVTQHITDRELVIGSLSIERGLNPTIELTDVALANAEWANQPSMLRADRITATVNLSKLFTGILQIGSLSLSNLELNLAKNTQGETNWQFSRKPSQPPGFSRLALHAAIADHTRINYIDQSKSVQQTLDLSRLNFQFAGALSESRLAAEGTVNDVPFELVVQPTELADSAVPQATVSESREYPFSMEGRIGKIQLESHGLLNQSSHALALSNQIAVHVDNLTDIGELIQRDLPSLGPLELSARIDSNPLAFNTDGLTFSDVLVNIDDQNLTLDAQGGFSGNTQSNAGELLVNLSLNDLNWLLDMAGLDKRLPGSAHINASLNSENNTVELNLHQGEINTELIDIQLNGHIEDLLDTAKATLQMALQAPNLELITQWFGPKMPPQWGLIDATALLQGSQGDYSINQIEATLNGDSTATATGSIASLIPFEDMYLDVQANLATLAEISAFTPQPLPDIGPFLGQGVVTWREGSLALSDARATYNGSHGIAVATGNIGDLIHFDQVRLRADADLPGFSALDLFTGFTMPDVDSVVASANLISTNALDLSAKNLEVTAIKDNISIVAKGSADSIIKNKAVLDLTLTSSLDSLEQLNGWSQRALPDIGPVTASARLVGSKQDIELNSVEATVTDDVLFGVVRTDIGYLNRMQELDLDIELQTTSVQKVLQKLSVDTTITAPANLATQVHINPGDDLVKLDNTSLKVEENELNADLVLSNFIKQLDKTSIAGNITVVNWNLLDLRDQPLGIQRAPVQQDDTNDTGKLLSDDPLPLALIARDDIDVNIRINQFTSTLFDVSDATLAMQSNNGVLTLGPFTGIVNQGQADFRGTIDTTINPPAIRLNVSVDEFDLSRAGLVEDSDLFENAGGTYARVNLEGRGASMATFMSSANGEGGLYIENLLFKQGALGFFSSDLIDQLANAFNPSRDKQKQTRFICSAMTFQMQEGSLTTPFGFAVESDDFSVLGNAEINFDNEVINVAINSKPKRGLGLSLNKFANLIKIDGQLAAPELSLSETGLLKFGASLAAAIASGGTTLLAEGLLDKQVAKSDVCSTALGD